MTKNTMTEEALEQRRLARVTHGGYRYLRTGIAPGCNVCIFGFAGECERYEKGAKRCALIEEMTEDLIREIMALDHIKDEDVILVEELARNKTFLWIVDKWLSRVGPFKVEALKKRILEGQPILKQRWVAANTMTRLADQLGLSPTSRARLGLDKGPEPGLAARAATIEAKKGSEELGDERESDRREALGASGRRDLRC